MGAAASPGIPCALLLSRAIVHAKARARFAPRERGFMSSVIARSAKRRSNPLLSFRGEHGLLRCARNDGAERANQIEMARPSLPSPGRAPLEACAPAQSALPRYRELGLDAPPKLASNFAPADFGDRNDLLLRSAGAGRAGHDRRYPHQCRPRQCLDLPQAPYLLKAGRAHHGDRERRQSRDQPVGAVDPDRRA